MNRRLRRNLFILILFMAVGFATVSTVLYINGSAKVAANIDDFKVYFSSALIDGEDYSNVIIDATKQIITYRTSDLVDLNQESRLDFKVTNGSTQYDADISINCVVDENEYVRITSSLEKNLIEARETINGELVAKLNKVSTENREYKITCSIDASAKERTTPNLTEIKEETYILTSTLYDEFDNPIPNANLVVFSNTPHYAVTNSEGVFSVSNLEAGRHEVFYSKKSMDELKTLTKEEVSANSKSLIEFSTNIIKDKYVGNNGYYLSEASLDDSTYLIDDIKLDYKMSFNPNDYDLSKVDNDETLKWESTNDSLFVDDENNAYGSKVGNARLITIYNGNKYYFNVTVDYPEANIYVSPNGNNTTGDGTREKPYLTVAKATSSAVSGNKIYIMPGIYNEMIYFDKYSSAGIYDYGKKLEIIGANSETIINVNGANTSSRDGTMVDLANSKSLLRNLTINYMPSKTNNYSNALFFVTTGTVANVYINVAGTKLASYDYNNNNGTLSHTVKNSTIYFKGASISGSYSGSGYYTNIATNALPTGKLTNTAKVSFGADSNSINENIEASKLNSDFNSYQRGVFYGEYAWNRNSVYNFMFTEKPYLAKVGDKLTIKTNVTGNLKYSTSNPEVASISKDGILEAKCAGKVTVYANYNGTIIEFELNVVENNKDYYQDANYYVSTMGRTIANGANGSYNYPFSSINDAIKTASSGDKIFILPGEYKNSYNLSSASSVALSDMGKALEIFGANEKTIINFAGSDVSTRDGNLLNISNANSLFRNMSFKYYPTKGNNYSNALFHWTNGTLANAFIYINGSSKSSYDYYNNNGTLSHTVKNSTIYFKGESISGSYSGSGYYVNVATNAAPAGGLTNTSAVKFGTTSMSMIEVLNDSKNNQTFIDKQRGVFFGTYAWK